MARGAKYTNLFSVLYLVECVRCAMEGFIVGGNETRINEYPHAVYLNIVCGTSFICGGSILNQAVVLTAGHCLEDCSKNTNDVFIKYGHEHVDRMKTTGIKDFVIHDKYDDTSMANDISLVLVKDPMKLGREVQRVILEVKPPVNIKLAYMAGWGVINEEGHVPVKLLDVVQELQSPNVCQLLGALPRGSFCAGPITGIGNPDRGDSGSALMIRKYIQIGLVSYKVQRYSLVVYTNVSYHLDWVWDHAARLVCQQKVTKKHLS